MIAKRIELRNMQMSSFSRLVQYITHSQGKHERVGTICVTNCNNDQPEWAALEAEAVQARNTRSQMDKTYHLLVSFREGDQPSAEVLQAIEMRICEKLGYGEHQRVACLAKSHVASRKCSAPCSLPMKVCACRGRRKTKMA